MTDTWYHEFVTVNNLPNSWDQYLAIIKQICYIRIVTLTGNKFQKLPVNTLKAKISTK